MTRRCRHHAGARIFKNRDARTSSNRRKRFCPRQVRFAGKPSRGRRRNRALARTPRIASDYEPLDSASLETRKRAQIWDGAPAISLDWRGNELAARRVRCRREIVSVKLVQNRVPHPMGAAPSESTMPTSAAIRYTRRKDRARSATVSRRCVKSGEKLRVINHDVGGLRHEGDGVPQGAGLIAAKFRPR